MDDEIVAALRACDGHVESAAALIAESELKAGPRMPRLMSLVPQRFVWMIPEDWKTQRYRLTKDDVLWNVSNTPYTITLPIFGKPVYMVKTAIRIPWTFRELEWTMAVRNVPRTVLVVSQYPLPVDRLKDIVKEIQSGVDAGDNSFVKAFRVKHVNIPHTIHRQQREKSIFQLRFDLAREIGDELVTLTEVDPGVEKDQVYLSDERLADDFPNWDIRIVKDRLSARGVDSTRAQFVTAFRSSGVRDVELVRGEEVMDKQVDPIRDGMLVKVDPAVVGEAISLYRVFGENATYARAIDVMPEQELRALEDLTMIMWLETNIQGRLETLEGLGASLTPQQKREYELLTDRVVGVPVDFYGDTLIVHPDDMVEFGIMLDLVHHLMALEHVPTIVTRTRLGTIAYADPVTREVHIPDSRHFRLATTYLRIFLHEYGHWSDFKFSTGGAAPTGRYRELEGILQTLSAEDVEHASDAASELQAELTAHLLLSEVGLHEHQWLTDTARTKIHSDLEGVVGRLRFILVTEVAREVARVVGLISPRKLKRADVIYPVA